MKERKYLCIDLKSFYASVECVERGLDPFKTNLVVADTSRTAGTVCLAITPAMKMLGIKNRCRIFEIPKNVQYIVARPRMKLYMNKSAEIYSIYLKYISPDDIHIYSIDECFFDITDYLKIYNMTEFELGKFLTEEVYKKTGIRATVGIGSNLFLAKIALDITAKHSPDFMGYLNEDLFKKTLWTHRPITDFWNIGHGIAKRLEKYGIYDLKGIAQFEPRFLYKELGVNAELLIDHANGIETCTIKDIKEYTSKSMSLSTSQILFREYNYLEALTVLKEMLDGLVLELIENGLVAGGLSLSVGWVDKSIKPVGGSERLGEFTDSYQKIYNKLEHLFYKFVEKTMVIKRLAIGLYDLVDKKYKTYDFLTDWAKEEKQINLSKSVIAIKNRYGKNAILKGISFTKGATARERNKMVGGHNSGEEDR